MSEENKLLEIKSSEFACQYWSSESKWRDSSIYSTEREAIQTHNRIQKAFPNLRYRVVERVATERIVCETNRPLPKPPTANGDE